MIKPFLIAFTATAATLLIADNASAQTANDGSTGLRGDIVTGIAVIPEYEGAKHYTLIPLANGRVSLDKRYIEIEGVTARINVLNSDVIELGPVANLTFGRDRKIDSAAVARLGVIDDAFEVGGFAALNLPVGDSGRVRLAVQAVQDVSSVHKGWLGQASAGYALRASPKLSLSASASATYASGEYAQTYYSVTAPGAVASGLPSFDAEAGLKDIGVSLGVRYQVTDRWSINATGGYKRLLGDFADSPIVSQQGDANQWFAGVGIGFSF